ncbi:single-strand binding protein [Bifidobacterium actinocoloniiforme DSM 22766]|uniref:Single-stranded DNA-binding protein n=1 Tax=Bifidobacterium actinocoloniiforme DSM 22766 TaxID=1437605 RepID=A0A086Z1J5_9BIFI|nr:single-stranded DNA-binding protein [Bifidobacterium actinocoloniiforme]AKV55530.1 hypothetical protein AB656_04095 [Bifidobacterium actinocoloniiforme DSM 22766]KFI40395.1 single-strand binding protein [Bifidobacterium actinocoloniiforme DSM 22766]
MSTAIELTGNAGGDPETRTFQGGSVTTVSVAVNQGYMDQSHNWVEQGTAWYRVRLNGKQALDQAKYIHKGTKLLVNGGLKVREYTDKQGQARQALEVSARHVGIIHSEPRQQQGQAGSWGGGQGATRSQQQPATSDPWGAQDFGGGNGEPEF